MVALAVAVAIAAPVAQAKKAAPKVLTVCKHGCVYTTIQKAVNAAGRKATIKVKPGKYVEGVIVSGHKYDGLHIIGVGKKPSDVVLEGRHARGPGGAAQNGIDGENVNNLDLENFKAEHFAANGVFINTCHGYLMKNLVAGFNHSYGLYVFKCVGGRMTKSVGYGNGDSAFYVGGTPFEKHPVTTTLDHLTGYENVLGYSGTNSKYILIRDSEFYNNGAGVVPNTLASEPDEPATSGVIEHNLIYWNNFDYYRPGSPVATVSGGVGSKRANYPIGAGVILFGTHRLGGQEQLDLRQLPVGRRGVLRSHEHDRQGREQRQQVHRQQDGRAVQRRKRFRLLQRRVRQGHLLREQRRGRDVRHELDRADLAAVPELSEQLRHRHHDRRPDPVRQARGDRAG